MHSQQTLSSVKCYGLKNERLSIGTLTGLRLKLNHSTVMTQLNSNNDSETLHGSPLSYVIRMECLVSEAAFWSFFEVRGSAEREMSLLVGSQPVFTSNHRKGGALGYGTTGN